MSLFTNAPFSSLSVYRKDFAPKICPRRPSLKRVDVGFVNPIAEPYEEHILPRFKYERLSTPDANYPDPKAYAEEVAEKYPSTRIFLRDHPGGGPDLDVIDKLYKDENRSIYMVSYCQTEDYDSKTSRAKRRLQLSKDWIIPLTTYGSSYRRPDLLMTARVPKIIRIPKDNLSPSEREREILEVKTGETIYNTDISNTGYEIIKGKLHGEVNIRPTFDEDDLLRAKLIRKH